jgi:hypothetical protein
MTCVIAHKDGWMVADRRVVFGIDVGPFKVNKVFKDSFSRVLVGVAGIGAFTNHLQDTSAWTSFHAACADVSTKLKEFNSSRGEDSSYALVCSKGNVAKIDPSGGIYEVDSTYDYWAIGDRDTAIGYLDGLREAGVKIDSAIGIKAIEYVGRSNLGVGDGVQLESV